MPRPNRGASLKWNDKRKRWYVVWYECGKERVRSTRSSDSGPAEAFLADFIRTRQRAQRGGPRDPGEVPIAEVLDLYGVEHAPTKADPARIGYAIAALLPYWGERFVGDVTKETCRGYARARGKSAGTIRRELGTLQAAIGYSFDEGRLTRKVAVALPQKPEGKDRWLTRHEAAKLLNAARGGRADVRLYLPLFIVLGLYTGARKEAILSLRWPQVDFEHGRINFARGEQTNKKRAHIPIPERLVTFLRLAYRRRHSDIGFVVHDKGRQIKDIGGAWNGKQALESERQYAQGAFGRACFRAKLANVSPHTLRHTCGTWLAQAGVDLHKIGGWLGHSDTRTTMLYAHHHPDYQDEARDALDRRKA
jgi:integrase